MQAAAFQHSDGLEQDGEPAPACTGCGQDESGPVWGEPVSYTHLDVYKRQVQKQGRHKKQTGGSGQFGDVWIRFEPQTEQDDICLLYTSRCV